MKVLLVLTRGDEIGGAQLYVQMLAERLQHDGHEVQVVTGTAGALTKMLTGAGIPTVICPSLRRKLHPVYDLKAIWALRAIIREFSPDLVSAHSSKAGAIGRLASRLQGVPCIFTVHGWAFAGGVAQPGRSIWRLIERLAEPLATRLICVSHFDRNLALQSGFHPSRLLTIHNGIPDVALPPRPTSDSTVPVRIVMVARFCAQKDHRSLLRAIQTIPNCELDLIGDGPLEASIKTFAGSLDIGPRVHFLGYRSDIPAVLARADVFVLASNYEGFPLTTLEAMRASLPTIVSDVGGAGEAVIDGVSGYIVPRGDVTTLRDRIRSLVEQPERRETMGAAGREAYLASFTFEQMYHMTLDAYTEVCGMRRQRDARGDSKTRGVQPAATLPARMLTPIGRNSGHRQHGSAMIHAKSYIRNHFSWRPRWD